MTPTRTSGKGWSIITSIIGELDTVLYYINDKSGISESLKDFLPGDLQYSIRMDRRVRRICLEKG